MMSTLADALPREQARCRELLGVYRSIGVPGALGAAMIEASLREAEAAVMSGDVVRVIKAYEDLKGYKE